MGNIENQEYREFGHKVIARFEKISANLHNNIFKFAEQTIEGGDIRFALEAAATNAQQIFELLHDAAVVADKYRATRKEHGRDWIEGHIIDAYRNTSIPAA